MPDSHKKSDSSATFPESASNSDELVVVSYEQIPLDKADSLERPVGSSRPRAIVPPDTETTGRTVPWLVGGPSSSRPRAQTLPYSPQMQDFNDKPESVPAVSGIRSNTPAPADVQEALENAERLSAEISSAARPGRLPDLTGLFEDETEVDTYVEQSQAFRGLGPGTRISTQKAVRQTLPALENEPDSANSAPEVTYDGPNMLPPALPRKELCPTRPVVYSRSAALPPKPQLPASVRPQLKPSTIANAPLQEVRTAPPVTLPRIKEKVSMWSRMRGAVGQKLAAAKESVSGFVRKHKAGVAVAAATSLAAATGAGLYMNQSQSTDSRDNADNTYQTVDTPAPSSSAEEAPAPVKTPKTVEAPPVQQNVEKAPAAPRKFSKKLEDSKSPLVQDIINNGKAQLSGSILGNTMLMPFAGLANDAQKAELSKLQRSINLGMGVFFNEHFGTPDKVATSMKDPNLRSLYSTAKVMKEKGWTPPSLTKDKYPEEYQLAVRIFEDSHLLGLDKTDNLDPSVQARVNGNMFQAKKNGDTLQLQKADGSYHVVLEAVFNIFDGKTAHDTLQTVTGTSLAPPPTTDLNKLNSAPSHTLNQSNPTTPVVPILQNNYMGGQPALISRGPDTGDVDAEWEVLGQAMDQLAAEKKVFEKDLVLEVEVAGGLSRRELHSLLIGAVGEKLAMLYPMADRNQVVGMVKRFGYIGFHLVDADPATGKCQVKVYKNVYKILKAVLDKKIVRQPANS